MVDKGPKDFDGTNGKEILTSRFSVILMSEDIPPQQAQALSDKLADCVLELDEVVSLFRTKQLRDFLREHIDNREVDEFLESISPYNLTDYGFSK